MDEHAEVVSLGLLVGGDYVYLHDLDEERVSVETRKRVWERRGGRSGSLSLSVCVSPGILSSVSRARRVCLGPRSYLIFLPCLHFFSLSRSLLSRDLSAWGSTLGPGISLLSKGASGSSRGPFGCQGLATTIV